MDVAAHVTEPTAPRAQAISVDQLRAAFPQFDVIEIIGQGGMGTVFKVRQPKLDRLAALKLLPHSLAADPAFAQRFEREAKLLAKLSHPNIVSVYDFGQAGDFFYLLMEYVDGVNLRQAMRAGRFTPEQALAIVPKICDALQYAHDEGVLHRDIKPENILLDAKGRVKLVDFGIAKLVAETDPPAGEASVTEPAVTQTGVAIGTPSYMAPEQREHPADVDHRADIYSLGVVFYELLTGELPSGTVIRPSERSHADPRVDAIVQQALQKERDRRQRSAEEVRTQVQTVTGCPSSEFSVGRGPEVSSLPRKAGLVRLVEILFDTTFTSPLAVRLIHFSNLGFLAFLGNVPWPGMQRCFGFSGFFGLIGVAFCVEGITRRKAARRSGLSAEAQIARSPNPRRATAPPAPASSVLTPRFSRLAILAACFPLPIIFLTAIYYRHWQIASLMADYQRSGQARPGINLPMWLQLCSLPAALLTPYGTTICGLAAIVWIRRSKGRTYGLAIALFAGLVYPLLWLDLAILSGFKQFAFGVILRGFSGAGYYRGATDYDATNLLAIATGVLVDFIIVWIAWRLINKSRNLSVQLLKSESGNPRLAGLAMMISATGGMLGMIIWPSLWRRPEALVWSILVAAMLGIFLAAPVYKTLLGKQALLLGIAISAIWIAVFSIRNMIPAFSINGSTASLATLAIPVMAGVATKGDLPIYLYGGGQIALPSDTVSTNRAMKHAGPVVVLFKISDEDVRELATHRHARKPLAVDIYTPGGNDKMGAGFVTGANNGMDFPIQTPWLMADVLPIGDARLYPADVVEVRLLLETKHGVVVVPRSAVFSRHSLNAGNDCFVYVIQPNETILTRAVNIGKAERNKIEITRGISPGEVVVTHSTDQLPEGAKVRWNRWPAPDQE
jgi:serine/threonine protein kinase